jgi:hypothetical protein
MDFPVSLVELLRAAGQILSDAFFRPHRLRRRAALPENKNRITWLAMAALFAVPAALFLLLWSLGRLGWLAFFPTGALDWARLGIAVGYLLVYVGAVSEGVVLGIVGGLAGVLIGGLLDGAGQAAQFAAVFGLALGAAYNIRRGRKWRLGDGLREAALGSVVFFAAGAVLEGSPVFLPLAQRGGLAAAAVAAWPLALRGGLPAAGAFAGGFLSDYIGLLFYPFELALFARQAARARRDPARALMHLRQSPASHAGRRLPLRWLR